uniref:Gag-Pol polyprotein n=1 Tax=Tanacetum cinerariifolium TaxID=118510 RepID=A0A6L2M658_TANCI|nr:Gag-Pol polyprotein [Tanacetum cinerariifolium]
MKVILRKDKCLAAIGERPAEVTDDSKWDEMDEKAIANLLLALADGVLSSIEEKKSEKEIWDHLARFNVLLDYLVFDDVAAAILVEENRRNNMEDRKTSSTQVESLVVTRGSTSEDGNALCCEAAIANENRKRFADVWLFNTGATFHMTAKREWFHQYKPISGGGSVYSCNDHELKIIGIRSIMVKMHDGTVRTIRDKLGHMSEQRMKILVERKLLPVLTKNWFTLMCGKHRFYPWEEKIYKARVKLDSGKKIKCLRTDNGGEYTGDEFDTFCKQEGIKRQFTTAYTPQQNGVAKQMNRTLLERAREMLATTCLGKSFWAKAVNTACYVINRSPSIAVELKTLMKMWTGKPVNYSDLHIFGSPVYVMHNTQETTKLDLKSRKCLFLGYADRVRGYRLWDPTAHKVVVSRDVVFMEDKIQENEKGDGTTWETTSIHIKKEFQSNDSFEAAPEHEVNETNQSQAPATQKGKPSTLQEALNNPDASFWKEAMQEEIKALHKNKTLVERYLARLVVKGYAQKEGIDFNENIFLCGPNKDHINKLKAQLAREFEMKDLGPANKILGMQIHRDRVSRKIWLSQKSYVKKILQRFNMQDCKPISTPFPTNAKLSSKMSPSSEKERMEMSRVPYTSAVGSLMFAMICTRPDIAHAVGVVSRYMAEPGREHWEVMKRILKYLKGTSDVALCFGKSDFTVKGYSVVAMSTTKAEYVAAAQASKEAA